MSKKELTKDDVTEYVDQQIELLTEKINDDKHAPGDLNDDVSRGKLVVYSALAKGVKKEKLSNQELGVVGAVNDVLQNLRLVGDRTTLLSLIDNLPARDR
ncbi:hypothetical protein [Pseudomonas bohemica]|uniref:hypothetical protein n=1 Tax=Pseudomonas bohemica TaxID=2044872 RepID=UPI000DA62112|nr:hypothetical protein [Pseudomonas bohemica]